MYGDVVLGLKPASKEEMDPFEVIIDEMKEEKGVEMDTDLTVEDLKNLVTRLKQPLRRTPAKTFPLILGSNYGEPSWLYLIAGTMSVLFTIVSLIVFRMIGVRLLTFRPWYLGTW
jgi:hypothetical protein